MIVTKCLRLYFQQASSVRMSAAIDAHVSPPHSPLTPANGRSSTTATPTTRTISSAGAPTEGVTRQGLARPKGRRSRGGGSCIRCLTSQSRQEDRRRRKRRRTLTRCDALVTRSAYLCDVCAGACARACVPACVRHRRPCACVCLFSHHRITACLRFRPCRCCG